MSEEVGRRLGNMDAAVRRFVDQFKQAHATIEGAGRRIDTARDRLAQADRSIGASIESVGSNWRAPTIDVAKQLADLARSFRRLRRRHALQSAWLVSWRSWLQVRVFWHRHWRTLLVATMLLIAAWVATTYGPPAWAWVTGVLRDIGALPLGVAS